MASLSCLIMEPLSSMRSLMGALTSPSNVAHLMVNGHWSEMISAVLVNMPRSLRCSAS